tara:strand:+ start:85 stop:438 length:354 start_codon:yes stop_codon:yes gene_type:complete
MALLNKAFAAVDLITAIMALKADAQVSVSGEDLNKIIWHDGNPTNITNEQILAKQAELKGVYDTKQYQRDRLQPAPLGTDIYPSVGDQLDMIYHDQMDGTTTFKDAIKVVKDAHPKP